MGLRVRQSNEFRFDAGAFMAGFTLADVNRELGPWVRMTVPDAWEGRAISEWPVGEELFVSWILLLGVLPIDRHVFGMTELRPGRGFDEQSRSLVNRYWKHTRDVVPINGGCRITDEIEFECRLPLLGYLLRPVYAGVFWWRHRRLSRLG